MYPTSGSSNFETSLYQNLPNASLAFTMWTTTFGAGNFMIQPASPQDQEAGFPSIPYLSLEALMYQQQMSNPVSAPNNILTGNTSGAQNISGQQTMKDGNGQTVYVAGYSANG